MNFRKWISLSLIVMFTFSVIEQHKAHAQVIEIAQIIKAAVTKVIKAVDLMVQRLQTKAIWLQNAQKVIENKLHQLKLTDIANWTEKHRQLYAKYFNELWEIKTVLAAYQRINQIIQRQKQIVQEYNRAWNLVSRDGHFTQAEVDYMYRVYKGILNESIQNIDQLLLVIKSFNTQMTDAQRLAIITQTGNRIERTWIDLLQFNRHTYQLSFNRSRTQSEIDRVKRMYGLKSQYK